MAPFRLNSVRNIAARRGVASVVAAVSALAVLGGCASSPQLSPRLINAAYEGRYGPAREAIQRNLTDRPSDRDYILDRMRLLILTLADGQPAAAEEVANQTYALLRTQGLNEDRTVSAVVFNEGVKIWKGEPFEQALGYHYIAVQKAMLGEWDNARAAAQSSLFLLKNFAENERAAQTMTTEDVARRAAEADRRQAGAGDRYLDNGYTPVKTDFTLGYLMTGIAARALGRDDEASDNFSEAARIDPALAPLAESLRDSTYNTVLVVDVGRGPVKTAYGPDNALVRFLPTRSYIGAGLTASVRGGETLISAALPPAENVNQMSQSHMWNNLEDVRQAKSTIGSLLVVGGLASAVAMEDDEARLAGVGVALAGLIMKASSAADTRYNELLPAQVFLVPLNLTEFDSTVTLDFSGDARSRMVLSALNPPAGGDIQLRYVRIPPYSSLPWLARGEILYANEYYQGEVEGDGLPYILGGRCVRPPTQETLQRYQRAGNLLTMTTVELENLYRAEGITFRIEDQVGVSFAHVLEGGTSLVAPLPGTTGYQRLFAQFHAPNQPRSREVRDVAQSLAAQQRAAAPQNTSPTQ